MLPRPVEPLDGLGEDSAIGELPDGPEVYMVPDADPRLSLEGRDLVTRGSEDVTSIPAETGLRVPEILADVPPDSVDRAELVCVAGETLLITDGFEAVGVVRPGREVTVTTLADPDKKLAAVDIIGILA